MGQLEPRPLQLCCTQCGSHKPHGHLHLNLKLVFSSGKNYLYIFISKIMDGHVCCGSHLQHFVTYGIYTLLPLQKPKTSDFGQVWRWEN